MTLTVPSSPSVSQSGASVSRVAVVMVHISPLIELGATDAGGMTVYVRALAEQLAALGVEVDIFTRRTDPEIPEVTHLQDGVRVVTIAAGPAEPVQKDDLYCYLPDFASEMALFSLRTGIRYDVVHTHYWLSGWVGHLLKRYWNTPVVHMYHTLGHLKNAAQSAGTPESPLRLRIERELLHLLDFFVAPNPDERAELVWGLGASDRKICTIPPGIDLNLFHPRNRAAALRELELPDRPMVLFVGRIDPIKDLDTLIASFKLVRDRMSSAERPLLAIIGGEVCSHCGATKLSSDLSGLRERIQDLGVEEDVLLLGSQPQDKLPLYYAAASVCVMPSLYESFGLVVVEAMACGLPVIATRVGGMKFTVEEGVSGLLVPRQDPQKMANAINQVLQDHDLRSSFQIGARQAAIRFSWHTVGSAVHNLYQQLVEGRSSSLCCYGEIFADGAQIAELRPTFGVAD